MTALRTALDPLVPRFCAHSGAPLPFAWELAWSDPTSPDVVRLVPTGAPAPLARGPWPRALHLDTRLSLRSGVRLQRTPVPFLRRGKPVAVLFGTAPPAFVEVPEAVGDSLAAGTSVAAAKELWDQPPQTVDHLLVGMVRLGLLHAPLPAPAAPGTRRGGQLLLPEGWVDVRRRSPEGRAPGDHVLTSTATGHFLRIGQAAWRVWQACGAGVHSDRLSGKLRPLTERLLDAGMLRAVETD
ncbi:MULTISPECIES: hypothetical protein [Streptomyces]|uniref:Uncharacterized protein n=2 Tax=Streptomyces TaxID=1883 RepID=A0A3R7FEZ2_9ACTN|nr:MULTISPECIES: hypothetical protein [Streptomyces]KNE83096.1 hypothetical protein ADZ36_07100 [Streptomyces fradiae]OFA48466.1 hypothetical protein BEN35_18735 [Streptomyces fradiae]PQM20091.1 hypothetical protein Sfr7A_28415 [Streptomyces xinghaiensis]RKM96015.1 hypothetical protein SFRA_013590 [Streptomyces xinghaiensis]RNC69972.1 hypothetical protein DC095_027475 [Streptomyces xinghaiensis]